MDRPDGFKQPRHAQQDGAPEDPIAALDDPRRRAIEDIDTANRAYAELISRMQSMDLDFAINVTGCETLDDALVVCGEWMRRRTDALVVTQKQFMLTWLAMAEKRFRGTIADPSER